MLSEVATPARFGLEPDRATIDTVIMPHRMQRYGWTWRPDNEVFTKEPACTADEILETAESLILHRFDDRNVATKGPAPHFNNVTQRCECNHEFAPADRCLKNLPGEEQVTEITNAFQLFLNCLFFVP